MVEYVRVGGVWWSMLEYGRVWWSMLEYGTVWWSSTWFANNVLLGVGVQREIK